MPLYDTVGRMIVPALVPADMLAFRQGSDRPRNG